MDPNNYYPLPLSVPSRKPTSTSVANPQWTHSPDTSTPPPYTPYEDAPPVPNRRPEMGSSSKINYNPGTHFIPPSQAPRPASRGQDHPGPSSYSQYEQPPPPPPSMRPPVSMPPQMGFNPGMHQDRGYFAGVDPNYRPVSRDQQPQSQMLHPPNRLRVMTSMPNLSANGRYDPSPISPTSRSPSPISSSRPSPLTPFTPGATPISNTWPQRPTTPSYATTPNIPTITSTATPKSLLSTALSTSLHFASGLIPHPTESTKHYTILRHSPALIFYCGPTTSLAITIFSSPNHPLPSDRTLWLQQRGYSGDSGMKLKALVGATSTWLNVTPSVRIKVNDLAPDTEKSWQRDILRAGKRLVKDKGQVKGHVARETHVVRIPEAAEDGYFRLLLCAGGDVAAKRKTLCPSPIFRVASTSTDSSVFKGASLSTMPIEVGVKVASVIASTTVNRYVGPVKGGIQKGLDRIPRPGFVAAEAGRKAFSASGLREKVIGGRRIAGEGTFYGFDGTVVDGGGMGMGMGMVVGSDEGPETPFPIKFQGRVGMGTGTGRAELGMPTANLAGVPEDIKTNLKGIYFGWACLPPGRGVDTSVIAENCWYEAIIMATPSAYASVIASTEVKVYLAHEFGDGAMFTDAKMKVIVMGFIRPVVQAAPGTVASVRDRLEMASQDFMVTMASLSRENWGPDMTLDRLRTAKSSRSLGDKFADVRMKAQRTVDKVPVHLAGIRSGDGELRDRIHGTGGYWLVR